MSRMQATVENLVNLGVPKAFGLPCWGRGMMGSLVFIQGIWRSYRMKWWRNATHFTAWQFGSMVNSLIGKNHWLDIVAVILCVLDRVLSCIKWQVLLFKAGTKFWETLKGKWTERVKMQLPEHPIWSPASAFSRSLFFKRAQLYCLAVKSALWHLLKTALILTGKMLDLADALADSVMERKLARQEWALNGMKCMKKIGGALKTLENNKEVVELILKTTQVSMTSEEFIQKVKRAAHEANHKSSKEIEQGLRDFGKRAIHPFSVLFGVHSVLPNSFAPPVDPLWSEKGQGKPLAYENRFAFKKKRQMQNLCG